MTSLNFIVASLWHHGRKHGAVALGVAVATAVLTGALLVGDSVRGSLRDLALERLGQIEEVLVTNRMFRETLAQELANSPPFQKDFNSAQPGMLLSGTLEAGPGRQTRRANGVTVLGIHDSFWSLGKEGLKVTLKEDEIALTESLARELGLSPGNEVLLRVPLDQTLPADSLLGEKRETTRGRRLRVATLLPSKGLARFSLRPSQQLPRNVFVPLATLQKMLAQPGQVNMIFAAGDGRSLNQGRGKESQLSITPRLADYGLDVELFSPNNGPSFHHNGPAFHQNGPAFHQIFSHGLVLPDPVVKAVKKAFPERRVQPVVTYLANTLVVRDREIPYSTITGIDSTTELGPLLDEQGKPLLLAEDEIVLNRWAADDLNAQVGDKVRVTFYEPESTHGVLREHAPPVELWLRAIVDLKTAEGHRTQVADPRLTPPLAGVTDQKSIADWEMPFELVETIRPQDEAYWEEYSTTPKAFVSLATAQQLWSSRWGTISLLRLPVDGKNGKISRDEIVRRLEKHLDPAELGFAFLPVKQLGLASASGTTPFDGLFLLFSLFLIASAVMLIVLLFQLGIQQRASEVGILAAVGIRPARIAQLLSREGLIVAMLGAGMGILAGVGYAWLILTGLRTLWIEAVVTPFLELHITSGSLLLGWFLGTVVGWLAIRGTIRKLVRLPVRSLLAGETVSAVFIRKEGPSYWPSIRVALFLALLGLSFLGTQLQGEAQAGAFFVSGALVLALLLGEIGRKLRPGALPLPVPFTLASLAIRNGARNRSRSTLTIGLVASAIFLIVALSAFRLEPSEQGTGGYALIATSDSPLHFDLNTPAGREELGFSEEENEQLAGWRVDSLRVREGEDASCLNLYRPTQPVVLGVPASFRKGNQFAWAAKSVANPWDSLERPLGTDATDRPIVPVVLDMNTALYSLHLRGVGARLSILDGHGKRVTLEVIGLLKNSLLQGRLLIGEENFLRLFPNMGGYQYFLLQPPVSQQDPTQDTITGILENGLSDHGFDVVSAREQLAGLLAVQNTYLATFQSLGALGLLFGTIGLAVAQLRSVLERRGELALLRAAGFCQQRLTRLVLWENGLPLVAGLTVGVTAAAVATAPHWIARNANVPWMALVLLLATITFSGMLATWLATRSACRAPLLPALKGE